MVSGGLSWRLLDDKEASESWDGWLAGFRDAHVKQSLSWSRFKRRSWRPLPFAHFNGPTPLAMGLGFMRRAPAGALTLLWMNGGPAFKKDRPRHHDLAALEGFLAGLKEHAAGWRNPLVRLNLETPMDLEAQLVLRQAGFVRPLMPLGTGLTYLVDLSRPMEELEERLERNWRNQLRSALKSGARVEIGVERRLLERYLPLHNALCERKGLKAQRLTLADLEAMAGDLEGRLAFLIASAEGRDGCGGAVWTYAGKGWFALSAADDWGLKRRLPNLMYWEAIGHLKSAGASVFDVTGIDPREGWGVYNFKRGLGAEPAELLGEWEWSPSDWTRRAFNLLLWWRRSSLP